MPTYKCKSRASDEIVLKYRLPYWLNGDTIGLKLLELRVQYVQHRDEMLQYQKEFAKDRETAKFFKEEAREALKLYRACCLLIPWVVGDPPGDCKLNEPYIFPEELFDYLDRVAGIAYLAVSGELKEKF